MDAKGFLFIGLGIMLAIYAVAVTSGGFARPTWLYGAIGFVTNFFDTLGIGSFATTTSIYKLKGLVPVKLIPGTLNVGHALPTIAQAFIYTQIVPVESRTLVLMILAACAGAWLGVGVVVHWPRRKIQMGMGLALLAAASLMLMTQLNLFPVGGDTLGLSGPRLWLGLGGNFVLGVLMMLGIGLYAPCMILISLLGMNPTAAFPIMMGSGSCVRARITCRPRGGWPWAECRPFSWPHTSCGRCRSRPSDGSSSSSSCTRPSTCCSRRARMPRGISAPPQARPEVKGLPSL
jgi:hypothetical protein